MPPAFPAAPGIPAHHACSPAMCPGTMNGDLLMNPLLSRPVTAVLVLLACCAALAPFAGAETCYMPQAKFSCEVNEALSAVNVTIECKDWSTSLKSDPNKRYTWYFRDLQTSYDTGEIGSKDAMFEYPGGRVRIYHSVTNDCGNNVTEKFYTFYCTAPYSTFEVDKDTGVAPLTVHITDRTRHQSSDVTLFEYRKNGVTFSTQRSPDITFNTPGTYTITQVVTKTCNPAAPAATSSKTITVNPALAVYSAVNFSGLNSTSPTTTVTTTVTPTVTTTPVWSAPVVPVYADTTAMTMPVTTAPAAAQPAATTQQAATAGATPAPSQAPGTPAPAAPGTGTLSVVTNPSGAQVFVDDVMRGLSPANLPGILAGQHTLRLEKSGYRNMTVPVNIEAGKTTDYSTGLEAESGGMGITPIIAAVLVIAAVGGGAYWYTRKKGPGTGGQT